MRTEGYSFNNSNPTFGYKNVRVWHLPRRSNKLLRRTVAGVNVGKAFNVLEQNYDSTVSIFHGPFDKYVSVILKPYKPGLFRLIAEKFGLRKPPKLTNNPLPTKEYFRVDNPDDLFKMSYEDLISRLERTKSFNKSSESTVGAKK